VYDLFRHPYIRKEGLSPQEVQMLKKIIFRILRFILFFIIAAAILCMVFILYFAIQYDQTYKDIQQALDRTCGVNVVLVSEGRYNDDTLSGGWDGGGAWCDRSSGPHEWECNCGDRSP
jgi:hypothetical protein